LKILDLFKEWKNTRLKVRYYEKKTFHYYQNDKNGDLTMINRGCWGVAQYEPWYKILKYFIHMFKIFQEYL